MVICVCYALCFCLVCDFGCVYVFVFFLMIRRPPRSTQSRSSAASDVYKRQVLGLRKIHPALRKPGLGRSGRDRGPLCHPKGSVAVSYTHLRAHETVLDLVCRLLLEKKKQNYKTRTLIHADNRNHNQQMKNYMSEINNNGNR